MSRLSNKKNSFRILPKKKGYTVLLLVTMLIAAAFLAMIAVVDAFPPRLTAAFVVAMLITIMLSAFLFRRERVWLRAIGIVVATLFIAIYGLGIYYMSTTYAMFARIITEDDNADVAADRVDVTEGSFNIYITGIDQWNEEKGLDLERSDVNMIVTVCPKTHKILLTSIPRDSYVRLHTAGKMDKLTHTGVYGVDETLNTVRDWLGIDLNYYVKMNFSACVDLVDAMGGIDLYNPKAFKGSLNNHPYPKGNLHLMGRGALYYARERKAYGDKDSQRVVNQQRVVKAVMKKLTSSTTLLTNYGDILGAVSDGMEMNMPQEDITALVKMQLSDMSGWDIETQKIEGNYDMDYVASLTQEQKFLVYKTDKDSVKACIEGIDKVMNPSPAEVAKVTAERQKSSMLNFIKSILGRGGADKDAE